MVSDEFKQECKSNVQNLKYGTINIVNTATNITENNDLQEFEINSSCYVNDKFIGTTVAKKATIKLLDNGTYNLENRDISIKTGVNLGDSQEYQELGIYTIPKPNTEEVSGNTNLTGYDYMKKFDIPYVDYNQYPIRLDECLEKLCKQAGLELGSKDFPNNGYMIKGNPFTNGETCKIVLSNLTQLTAGFAEVDMEDGKLYIRNFDINGDPVETIDMNNYEEFKPNNIYGKVNSVRILMNSGVDGEETIKEAEGVTKENRCQITISDNYYLNSAKERKLVIDEIFNALNGLTYLPIELNYYGYPWLKLGQKIRLKDTKGNEYITYVMEHTLKYDGSYSGTIKATALTKTQQAYSEVVSLKKWRRKTELAVDKIDGNITSIIEEQNKQTNKIAQVEQTVEQLNTKISETADVTTSADGFGTIEVANVNASEPIVIKIHSTGVPIRALYPSTDLYPSTNLYPHKKEIKFIRKDENGNVTNEIMYDLPADLYWYSNEIYDEFILDYENQKCYILRRTEYNAGTVTPLGTTIEEDYDYPTISLEDGDYTISMPTFETAYIYVKLMGKNIYTTQFATHVELNSAMNQTKNSIKASVQETLTNYVTNTHLSAELELKIDKNDNSQIISMINASANEINLKSNRLTIDSDYFTLTKEGMITAVSGNIGGFDITNTNLNKEISGLYDYNEFDYCIVAGLITGNINQESNLINIMDIDNSNSITAIDYTNIKNIVNGVGTNTKIQNGKLTIDSTNVKKAISITDSDYNTTVSLGINGVETTLLNSSNIICGSAINTFSGFMFNGSAGTFTAIENNNAKAKITASGEINCVQLTQTSLAREKKNISKYNDNALDIINSIDIYKFNFRNENDNSKRHLGFIIGNKYNYSQEITNNKNNGVDLYSFISLCCQAIKEQSKKIETLKMEVQKWKN